MSEVGRDTIRDPESRQTRLLLVGILICIFLSYPSALYTASLGYRGCMIYDEKVICRAVQWH
jgi:hypothetical protein